MSALVADSRPGPAVDVDSADYWQALAEHRVVAQRCLSCGEQRIPPMPSCPNCGHPDSVEQECSGRGTIYSWIVVRVPVGNVTAADLPCTIATVELDGGGRVVGRVIGGTDPVIGGPVSARFVDHPTWTELAFVGRESA